MQLKQVAAILTITVVTAHGSAAFAESEVSAGMNYRNDGVNISGHRNGRGEDSFNQRESQRSKGVDTRTADPWLQSPPQCTVIVPDIDGLTFTAQAPGPCDAALDSVPTPRFRIAVPITPQQARQAALDYLKTLTMRNMSTLFGQLLSRNY